ncbi:MAG TPA: glycosyltransferase family 4 protein, partial [Coriobacteriia bacterium]
LSVDVDRFAPGRDPAGIRSKLGIPAHSRVVVFVGTLFPFTGLMRLLDDWDGVRAKDPRAHLLIVGGGPQEDELRQRASRLDDPGSVTMTGMVPYRDVPDHIRAADVGVCPFEILPVTRDINPVKVVGYLACGLPTVCSTLEGTMAVLPHEGSGVVYAAPGAELAEALVELLGDERERERLGVLGRHWAVENHSKDAVVAELEHRLRSAIGRASARVSDHRTGGS